MYMMELIMRLRLSLRTIIKSPRLGGLFFICVALLSGCASYSGSGPYTSEEQPMQREHEAFKAMIEGQPEFTEAELLKFTDDAEGAQELTGNKIMGYFVNEKGWPVNRATYMLLKLGMIAQSFEAEKRYSEIFADIPPSLYPTRAETDLARKHLGRITKLFPPARATPPGHEGGNTPHA